MSATARRLELAVAALVGGAVSGAIVWYLGRPPEAAADVSPDDPMAEPPGVPDEASSGDAERVAALERKVATLQRQIATRQRLEAYAEQLRDGEGGATRDADAPPADPEDPVFELAVRNVIDKANYERERERDVRREERREERVLRQVDYLADKLGLDDTQVARVEEVLTLQTEAFAELRDSDERPVTRREWREQARAIRDETTSKLAEVLSEEQMAGYAKLQEEEGFGRRGR